MRETLPVVLLFLVVQAEAFVLPKPQNQDDKGRSLSGVRFARLREVGKRAEREVGDRFSLELDSEDDKYLLQVKPAPNLLAENFQVYERSKDGLQTTSWKQEDFCHYVGESKSHPGVVIILSGCKLSDLMGTLVTSDGLLHLHPIDEWTTKKHGTPNHVAHNYSHILYKDDVPNLASDMMEQGVLLSTSSQANRRLRRSVSEPTMELAVFTDYEMYKYVEQRYPKSNITVKISEVVLAIMNGVQAILNHPSLGAKIHLALVKLEIVTSPTDGPRPMKGNIRPYLDSFCQWQWENKRRNDMKSTAHWDHAIMLTGWDLFMAQTRDRTTSGMAYLRGMCREVTSCTLSEGRSLGGAALIVSHEMGHNMGMNHDGEGNHCEKSSHIMGPVLSGGVVTWSPCSRDALQKYLHNDLASCLWQTPNRRTEGEEEHELHDEDEEEEEEEEQLPGLRFDANAQCLFMYGKGWRSYTGLLPDNTNVDVCSTIWCRRGSVVKTPNTATLEGTPCGEAKICRAGSCVPETEEESAPEDANYRQARTLEHSWMPWPNPYWNWHSETAYITSPLFCEHFGSYLATFARSWYDRLCVLRRRRSASALIRDTPIVKQNFIKRI